jgi:hypothetical protein
MKKQVKTTKKIKKAGLLEKLSYGIYYKLNTKRKAKQPMNRVFRAIDNIRRICGFVK